MNVYGSGFIPIVNYASLAEKASPTPPIGTAFWVEDLSRDQMVTEDGLDQYVFILG